jgi:hypothetical protein
VRHESQLIDDKKIDTTLVVITTAALIGIIDHDSRIAEA